MNNKLPVKKIFLTAISLPALYYRQLLKIGWPLLLVGAVLVLMEHLTIGGEDSYIDEFVATLSAIVFIITLVMAIVGCHRLFIFGPKADEEYKLIEWTGNEIKYAGWWILISLIAGLISLPIWLIIVPAFQNGYEKLIENQAVFYAVFVLTTIPTYYLISRWSMVLPASATDTHGKTLSWSWNLSKNNGWRLTLLIGFLPFITDLLFGLLPESQAVFMDLIIGFVWVVVGVIQLGLLSLSYAFLGSNQPSDTLN